MEILIETRIHLFQIRLRWSHVLVDKPRNRNIETPDTKHMSRTLLTSVRQKIRWCWSETYKGCVSLINCLNLALTRTAANRLDGFTPARGHSLMNKHPIQINPKTYNPKGL